ncbi:dihydropteroate synthase [Streptohalobacillus salinus]|uniref:Dihydropteroate synthase n=2 Tax=Streptohalobacillus salinus TaxID=621096 RepID=A0A2V3W5P9_9BACI|nr:dihydropteroate synthase [Streptohalobacillus salinus]
MKPIEKISKLRGNKTATTLIMGILNVTPDSFSDGGSYMEVEQALAQVRQMIGDGADIIDIGGESTRPGFTPVSIEEEIARIVPVIKAIRKESEVLISVDTYKSAVAREAIAAGADMINDVWGGKDDPEILDVAVDYACPIVLMHNRKDSEYKELIQDIKSDLIESIEMAKSRGVKDEQIILDPGIGFQKSKQDNLSVLRRLDELNSLGYPLLLGTSRKSFLGYATGLSVDERDEATAATTVDGIMKGIQIVRVHNVKLNKRVSVMADLLAGRGVGFDG